MKADTELQHAERLARHTSLNMTEALQLVVLNRAANLLDRELLVIILRAQRVAAASLTGERAFDIAYRDYSDSLLKSKVNRPT